MTATDNASQVMAGIDLLIARGRQECEHGHGDIRRQAQLRCMRTHVGFWSSGHADGYRKGRLHGSLAMALVLVGLFWVGVRWGRRG